MSASAPETITEVLTETVDLVYHPTIMALAGDPANAAVTQAYRDGNYVLVLEGGVPTAFGGAPCIVYTVDGHETTYMEAVTQLTERAIAVVCVGTCASFGGIPASGSNPSGAMSIKQLTGRQTINISGCPANPDWVVWAVVQLLLGNPVELDPDNRPVALYRIGHDGQPEEEIIHDKCPRNPGMTGTPLAADFGEDGHCLEPLGCRGPFTKARCKRSWNGIGGNLSVDPHPGHWCIGVNAPCQGCVEKTFPGPESFHQPYSQQI
jgi:hydrogenase small subunit